MRPYTEAVFISLRFVFGTGGVSAAMDSRQFRYLVEAIEQGSLNKAAEILHVSQPALSKAIRSLETELDVKLVERSGKGIKPTRFGKSLYSHAKAVVLEIGHAHRDITILKSNEHQLIVVGALPSFAAPLIAPAVARMSSRGQPVPHLKVVEMQEVDLVPELRRGTFDFAIGLIQDGASAPGLKERVLYYENWKIIARGEHPLANVKNVTARDMARYPWVLPPSGSVLRSPLENIFRVAGLPVPMETVEGMSLQFLKSLMLDSDYLVALSPHAFHVELQAGHLALIDVALPPLRRCIGLIHRDHHPIPAAALALVKEILVVSRSLGRT